MAKVIGKLQLYKNKYAEPSYKYVLRFRSHTERDNYFNSFENIKFTQEQCGYLMENDTVIIDLPYETARSLNYARFKNDDATNYMYYFITDLKYTAPGVTTLTLTLDVITTFLMGNYNYQIEGNIERQINKIDRYPAIEHTFENYRAESVINVFDEKFGILLSSKPVIENSEGSINQKLTVGGLTLPYYAYLLPTKLIQINDVPEYEEIIDSTHHNFKRSIGEFNENYLNTRLYANKINTKKVELKRSQNSEINVQCFYMSYNQMNNFLNESTFESGILKIGGVEEEIEIIENYNVSDAYPDKLYRTLASSLGGTIEPETQPFEIYGSSVFNSQNLANYVQNTGLRVGILNNNYDSSAPDIPQPNYVGQDIPNFTKNIYSSILMANRSFDRGFYFRTKVRNTQKHYYLKPFSNILTIGQDEPTGWLLYDDSDVIKNYKFNITLNQYTRSIGMTNYPLQILDSEGSENDGSTLNNTTVADGLTLVTAWQRMGSLASLYNENQFHDRIVPDILNNYSYYDRTNKKITFDDSPVTISPRSGIGSVSIEIKNRGQDALNLQAITLDEFNRRTEFTETEGLIGYYILPYSNELYGSTLEGNNILNSKYFNYIRDSADNCILNIKEIAPPIMITTKIDEIKTKMDVFPYKYYSFLYGDQSFDIKPQFTNGSIRYGLKYSLSPKPYMTIIADEKIIEDGIDKYQNITQNLLELPLFTSSYSQYEAYSKALTEANSVQKLQSIDNSLEINQINKKQNLTNYISGLSNIPVGIGLSTMGGPAGVLSASSGLASSAISGGVNLGYANQINDLNRGMMEKSREFEIFASTENERIQRMKPPIQVHSANNLGLLLTDLNKVKLVKWTIHEQEKTKIDYFFKKYGYMLNKPINISSIYEELNKAVNFDYIKLNPSAVFSTEFHNSTITTVLESGITFIDKRFNGDNIQIDVNDNNFVADFVPFTVISNQLLIPYDVDTDIEIFNMSNESLTYYVEDYEDYVVDFVNISFNGDIMTLRTSSDEIFNSIPLLIKCEEYPDYTLRVIVITQN